MSIRHRCHGEEASQRRKPEQKRIQNALVLHLGTKDGAINVIFIQKSPNYKFPQQCNFFCLRPLLAAHVTELYAL